MKFPNSEWKAYRLGVLASAHFVGVRHGEHTIAAELLTEVLYGESYRSLREQAKREEIEMPGVWEDYRHRVDRVARREAREAKGAADE